MRRSSEHQLLPPGAAAALFAGALGLSLAAPAIAQAPASQAELSAGELQKAIESRQIELESTKLKEKTIAADMAALDAEREKLNARLLETAALIQKSEGQLTGIEARLGELGEQEKLVRGSLNERRAEIAELLAALQRMGRNPPPVMITKREDALEMVRSAMLLASAFPQMKNQALALSQKLENLVRVMSEIRTEGEKLKAETERLNEMRTRLAGLMATKKQSITERQAELMQVRQEADEIAKNVDNLNDLIAKLDKAVTEKTGLGAYQEEMKVAAATPPPAAAAPAPPAAAPAEPGTPPAAASPAPPAAAPAQPDRSGEAQVVELAPMGSSLVPGSPGRIKPAIAFASAKGKLPLPAQGRRALAYGDKTKFGNTSNGIVLETRPNAQVTSPCDGWIVYAGEFRSYGQLLIINAGDGYHILLAGLSQIDVQPGQFVLAAEPVGTMGGIPKSAQAGSEGGNPVLYVEFRKDGDTVDPDPWWVAGQQKAQG